MRRTSHALSVLLLLLAARPVHAEPTPTIFGRPMKLSGFHFQVGFGAGGGPDTLGIFHEMEVGGTLKNGITLGLIHSFIQSKGVSSVPGPDLIGGWMFLFKMPVIWKELSYKLAFGPGGTHDQSNGITVHWGAAWLYGLDFSYPWFRGSGPTLSLVALHAVAEGVHHFGVSLGLAYTFF
jgi:hypothetical protein